MAYFLRGQWSLLPLISLATALACSASSGGGGGGGRPNGKGGSDQSGGTLGTGGNLILTGGTGTGGGLNVTGGSGGGGGVEACATETAKATLTSEPIDIIIVLDNSGSMAEEMEAAENNINQNFATILDTAGVDYRVILLSRHRVADRSASEAASTSICVSAPLSGLASCPSKLPVFSEKFFQYGEKIESFDALNWLIDGFNQPEEENDLAPNGYKEWLRPDAKKTIVLMTDDDESNDDEDTPLTVDQFLQQFTALSPEMFGTAESPSFRFHSIIGIAEKPNPTEPWLPSEPEITEMCDSNGADIESPGPTYQRLSIRTGGLRFPLCQFPGYDAVFQAIAEDVVVQAVLTCDFAIPEPPPGKTLELDKVAVVHTKADDSTVTMGQVRSPAECQDNAFYIQDGRVWLCDQACNTVKTENGANVSVAFTCESTIIVQ